MSQTSSEGYFPVKFEKHYNRYASVLYDVDGNPLVGETGETLNVFKEELKDLMIKRKIRFMHYMEKEPTYAYFVTAAEQLGRFCIDREEGSSRPNTTYHIYPDD